MSADPGTGMRNGLPAARSRLRIWGALRQLAVARILVVSLALPFGILLKPGVCASPVATMWQAAGATLVLSAMAWAGLRRRRFRALQVYTQLVGDLVLVTWLASRTGGVSSQFVLFYALVVLAGGLLARVPGGLFAGAGACGAILLLPAIAARGAVPAPPAPDGGLMAGFLAVTGLLAGVLGERVHRTSGDLERTARELNRMRIDNDVVLRHLATGVFAVDQHGIIGYMNPAAEQVLGMRMLESRGRHAGVALPERLVPLRDIVFETLQTRRGRGRAEIVVTSAAGPELPLGISTNVLTHEGELTGVVAVFQDLTHVREMERRMRRSETLAEVGALAAGIAHELRNGLKPISGSVEYLQRELQLEGEEAELMDLIARQSTRLNRFVTDLLAYSRERDLAIEHISVGDELRDVLAALRHDPRRGPATEIALEGPDAPVWADWDAEQMRQVWLNLAGNALEAIGESGNLTIRWEGREEDGAVVVEFIDSGVGIAADDLPRVGEPFFTTKRGGTGLGLAIAQRIVERHGGVLTVESEAGRGTTARVQLPVTAGALAAAA